MPNQLYILALNNSSCKCNNILTGKLIYSQTTAITQYFNTVIKIYQEKNVRIFSYFTTNDTIYSPQANATFPSLLIEYFSRSATGLPLVAFAFICKTSWSLFFS